MPMTAVNSSNRKSNYTSVVFWIPVLLVLLSLPFTAYAQLNVGSAATVDVGSGSINMNCSDVNVVGTMQMSTGQLQSAINVSIAAGALLQGNSGQIYYSGDWSNLGTLQAGQSSVNLRDDCNAGNSLIVGDNDFYQFSVVTQSAARELTVTTGSQQGFLGSLQLVGTGQGRINLHSSVDNTPAYFVLGNNATQLVENVDVRDNDASRGAHIAPVEPASIGSTRGVNVINWFIDHIVPVVPVPTLSAWALMLLITSLFGVGIFNARRRETKEGLE